MNLHINFRGQNRLENGHPWVFKSDIVSADPSLQPGDVVNVINDKNRFIGRGFYNPHSMITLRLLTRQDEPVNRDFLAKRIERAWNYRKMVCDPDSCRVIYSESDFLPSLVVDKFSDILVLQSMALGMDKMKEDIADLLMQIVKPRGIYERNDAPVRELEGMEQRKGYLRGSFDPRLEFKENGVRFLVDVAEGQKTGYFLDQKENRAALRPFVKNARVLDAFCHVGSFALHAANYGAREVIGLDISQPTLNLAHQNALLNGLDSTTSFQCVNVFDYLRTQQNTDPYDVIILDPPAFTKSRNTIQSAERGYKEINLRAMKMLKDGGYLVTCSCSHHMHTDHFLSIVQSAAFDAHRTLRLVELRAQGKDHPTLPAVPETQYLKCAIYQVFAY